MIPGFFLFITGILLNYFVIFPLSFRFLATYQVSELVVNKISISSYISSFTMLSLLLGAAFEIPIIAYFLSKLGLITAPMLKQYRKYAFSGYPGRSSDHHPNFGCLHFITGLYTSLFPI